MGERLRLQSLLENLLGSRNVYFQPPTNVTMKYPCIVYDRSRIDTRHANNAPYRHETRWTVTIIDRSPESPVIDKLLALPKCTFDRHFESSDLNHDVFNLYF